MLSIVQRALDNTEPAHSVDTSAVPPVRLLELAQAYEDNNGRWPTRRLRVPAASDACYTIHGESGGHTPSPSDNLAINCHDSGYDLSATIHHRWGQPAPLGTTYTIDCPALE